MMPFVALPFLLQFRNNSVPHLPPQCSRVPNNYSMAKATRISEKAQKVNTDNYIPVSLALFPGKITE